MILRTVCAMLLVGLALPAGAQSRGDCGNPDPDISIAACTKRIESGAADLKAGRGMMQATAARLATDYNKRGVAYAAKGQYDEAIADYSRRFPCRPRIFPPPISTGAAPMPTRGRTIRPSPISPRRSRWSPGARTRNSSWPLPITIAATPMSAKGSTTRPSPISPRP